MKFFLPGAKDGPKLAEETYLKIKANAERDTGWKTSPDRIFAIDYIHNGKPIHNEVGQPDPETRDLVVAIFSIGTGGRGPFLVCTKYRGVISGSPMIADANGTAITFDD